MFRFAKDDVSDMIHFFVLLLSLENGVNRGDRWKGP